MICRRELPGIEKLASDYEDLVTFVAPAIDSSMAGAAGVVEHLLPSGRVLWGLDENNRVHEAYGFRGMPAGAIVAVDKALVAAWDGPRNTDEIRVTLDKLLAPSSESPGTVPGP